MSEQDGGLYLDDAAVQAAGEQMIKAADDLRMCMHSLQNLTFGASHAGRDYAPQGEELHQALQIVPRIFEQCAGQ
jgi:hypothetical protein